MALAPVLTTDIAGDMGSAAHQPEPLILAEILHPRISPQHSLEKPRVVAVENHRRWVDLEIDRVVNEKPQCRIHLLLKLESH